MPLSWFDADKTVEVDMFALSARLGFDDESEITRVFRVPPELLELARGEGSRRGRWQRGDWFSALARRRRWRMLLMVLVSSAGVLALRWIS